MISLASVFRAFRPLLAGVLAAGSLFNAAHAACGDRDRIQCREEFEVITAVAWTGNGFAIAGQVRRDGSLGLALLWLTRTGEPRRIIALPLPGNWMVSGQMIAEPRKLIALPSGGLILVGQLQPAEETRTIGWAMRIADNGQVLWNKPIEDSSGSVVVHSAHYDPNADRVIVVGRLTLGSDDGQCEKWSQSLVVTLKASDGEPVVPRFTRGEQGRVPTNRQAIFDIIAGEKSGTFVVAGFATAAASTAVGARSPRRCLDNMFVGMLAPDRGKWTLATLGRVGSKDANEVAFSIKAAEKGGYYLLAGHHRDSPTDAAAAQAYRIRLAPFAVSAHLSTPYPPDGSDRTGGDRYRIIVPLLDKNRFLLAGSVSIGARGLNQAMWQIVSADLKTVDAPVVLSAIGSDIFDAAISPDGSVLVVGRWTDEEGRRVGFTGFIGERPVVSDRRQPDSRLADLSTLPFSDGAFRMPGAALSAPTGYFGRHLAAGSQVDLAFSVSATRVLKASVHTESGDVDLVISDRAGRPVAFSNFRGSATELLITTLSPGPYTLSILAQTVVPSYDVRLAFAQEIDIRALAALAQLSEEQRIQLADELAAAGYTRRVEPTIALGGETARSLLAAQEGARNPVGPKGIGKSIAQISGMR
jgi:hypothetical protein